MYLLFDENFPIAGGCWKDSYQRLVQRSYFVYVPTLTLTQQHRPRFHIVRAKFHCLLSTDQTLMAPFLSIQKQIQTRKSSNWVKYAKQKRKINNELTISILIKSFTLTAVVVVVVVIFVDKIKKTIYRTNDLLCVCVVGVIFRLGFSTFFSQCFSA